MRVIVARLEGRPTESFRYRDYGALATIGRAYGEVENLAWIVTAYLLTSTAVTTSR